MTAYRYLRLRAPRPSDARDVRSALAAMAVPPWGVFGAQIGTPSSELVAVIPSTADLPEHLDIVDAELVVATVRPTSSAPLTAQAVYAHRWFDIDESVWPEFLSLSEGAWPGFESANPGVQIEGFFRSQAVSSPDARVLLVTRYPNLATWEQSRNATDEAGGANFRRRHELTRKTVVATFRLLLPPGAAAES